MRLLPFLTVLALAGCAEPSPPPEQGALWPHRDRIAEALAFRTGGLSSTVRKKVQPCFRYWMSSEARDARQPLAICDENARQVRGSLEDYLDIKLSDADVRDPKLWRYVAERAHF